MKTYGSFRPGRSLKPPVGTRSSNPRRGEADMPVAPRPTGRVCESWLAIMTRRRSRRRPRRSIRGGRQSCSPVREPLRLRGMHPRTSRRAPARQSGLSRVAGCRTTSANEFTHRSAPGRGGPRQRPRSASALPSIDGRPKWNIVHDCLFGVMASFCPGRCRGRRGQPGWRRRSAGDQEPQGLFRAGGDGGRAGGRGRAPKKTATPWRGSPKPDWCMARRGAVRAIEEVHGRAARMFYVGVSQPDGDDRPRDQRLRGAARPVGRGYRTRS